MGRATAEAESGDRRAARRGGSGLRRFARSPRRPAGLDRASKSRPRSNARRGTFAAPAIARDAAPGRAALGPDLWPAESRRDEPGDRTVAAEDGRAVPPGRATARSAARRVGAR